MEKSGDISLEFQQCIDKLFSSIVTLRQYFSHLNQTTIEIFEENEELLRKFRNIKNVITNLALAIEQTNQWYPNSILIKHLSDEYLALWNDYQTYYHRYLPQTLIFMENKQIKENLLTNININDVFQSLNEHSDELNGHQILVLNQTTTTDLSDKQTVEMKEQQSLKDRCSSIDRLNQLKLENRLIFARQILDQFQSTSHRSSLDNQHYLSQFKECEDELNSFKTSFDDQTNITLSHSLIDELTKLAASITRTRIQLENQIAFSLELDSFYNWLKNLTKKDKNFDKKTIQLILNERRRYYDRLIKSSSDNHNNEIKEKLDNIIQMWTYLTSLITDSLSIVTTQSSTTVPFFSSCVNEQAQELLNTIVQLGNRQEIEQLKNQIQSFLSNYKDYQIFNLNVTIPDQICNELSSRQLILQQMLIDTSHIDHLRVNFVAHFNTENNVRTAADEITTLIENYPREMTTQVRQWLTNQQKPHLSNNDLTKIIEHFEIYLKELEDNLLQYQQNQSNSMKLKKLLQLIEKPPNLPDSDSRVEHLRTHFLKIKSQIDDIQKKTSLVKSQIDQIVLNINVLIQRIRDIEIQIQNNEKQPINTYEQLILDCQRIILELNQDLHLPVEQAINAGKRLYAPDPRDSSGIESADEIGGTAGSSSSSSSPLLSLKKHSDLTLRKVRRHVLQLSQYWKSANENIQSRLKVLQRVQTAVEDLRRKCDQLHAHLLEIELAYAHKPQIKALNAEKIPAEIEQAKSLLTTLMSWKASIDDIQQSAQIVENEYDIHLVNRAEELNQRWQHSLSSISQRIQSLQEAVKNSQSDIYSTSIEYPWQRALAMNKIPYYINHADQTTSWDHPKMSELMRSFSNFNDIRLSAYRTAMKLRALQKRLCLDLTSLSDIIGIFEGHEIIDSLNKNIDITEIMDYLKKIFEKTAQEYPQLVNVILAVDLTLNWLLNIYDINRTGTIRLLSMKMALALLCRGNIEEKYRYIFSLVTYEHNGGSVLDRQRLSILFQQAIVIPKQLGEVAAFGGSNVEPSVQSCFEFSQNPDVIIVEDFLEWIKLEPQSLVWLPVMHRLAASEAAKHEARCNICKIYPILGFRYRSLRYFNCDICQTCFFSGKQTKLFKMDHPLQEYYVETTSSEDLRDFFRIFKNKLWSKHRKSPRLGYLPLPHVFDNTLSTNESQTSSSSPILIPPSTTQSNRVDDEHGIIAQHCRNLNQGTLPTSCSPIELDNDQRHELEAIIHDLEDENRLLQNEYERLCQEHMEKTLIINEQHEQIHINDRDILREAKQLRQHKTKLEQRMKILEEHNKQLEKQLHRSKQLLFNESPSSTLHRQSSKNENYSNLVTIDNLFHMANDINRAVGDLVSVITEPQSTTSSIYPPTIVT